MKKNYRKLTIAALCSALCVVLPIAFHLVPDGGKIFTPMHLPVLLCGLVCGAHWGMGCGLAGPLLSFALTGMPNGATLPSMLIECAVYGLVSGLLRSVIKTKWPILNLYCSLIPAMLIGRVAAGLAKAWIFTPGLMTWDLFVSVHFVLSLPGTVLQLVLLPIATLLMEKLLRQEEVQL